MALDAHLQSLTRRHRELEAALHEELKNAHKDDVRTHELKRLKLRIKDQIAEVERRQFVHPAPDGAHS